MAATDEANALLDHMNLSFWSSSRSTITRAQQILPAQAAPQPGPAMNLPERVEALLDFWFGPPGDPAREQHRQIWFRSTPAFDMALLGAFLADYETAAAGGLTDWEASAEGALALVLLLDQLPRNIFRETARAYMTDAQARAVADRALGRGFDRMVPPAWRLFLYMPFHHSEDLADQRRSVALRRPWRRAIPIAAAPGAATGAPISKLSNGSAAFRTATRSSAGNRPPKKSNF